MIIPNHLANNQKDINHSMKKAEKTQLTISKILEAAMNEFGKNSTGDDCRSSCLQRVYRRDCCKKGIRNGQRDIFINNRQYVTLETGRYEKYVAANCNAEKG